MQPQPSQRPRKWQLFTSEMTSLLRVHALEEPQNAKNHGSTTTTVEGIFMDIDAHCLRLFLRRAYAGLLIHVLTITRCLMPNGSFCCSLYLVWCWELQGSRFGRVAQSNNGRHVGDLVTAALVWISASRVSFTS